MLTTITETVGIFFEYRSDYLFVDIRHGTSDLDERRDAWHRIAAEFKHHGYKKLLVLENSKEHLSTADVFQLASEIPYMGFGNGRSAYVDPDLERHDIADFGQTVAANRGLNCAVFSSVEDAEQWLRK